jgi:hypothetical protein
MNTTLVDKLARVLLYEGYILYPYRPSVKNQQRWTFGGVYPPSWTLAQEGTDPCVMQTQCLLEPGPSATVRVKVRFLQLVDRTVGELFTPLDELPANGDPDFRLVPSLTIGDQHYQPWQEAIEREVDLGDVPLTQLLAAPHHQSLSSSHQRNIEPLPSPAAPITAILIRRREDIKATIELSAAPVDENLIRITVRILNQTEMPDATTARRDDALMRTLISTHTILTAHDAGFLSLTDPPAQWKHHAAQCVNIGVWPVLVGEPGRRDTMLASPIIVEEYPRIAPESPGDLFDATEIDEILTLRIMTLTDDEKRIASGVDPRVRDLLARTQSLEHDQLRDLHGTFRGLEPSIKQTPDHGSALKAGDRVRLRPLGRSDVMDIALDGKEATVVSIEQDFENRIYVSVTVDDDPGRDLGLSGQPGHRFYFGVVEVEPLSQAEAAI